MAISEVRVLIPDLDTTNQIFTDAEITLFLSVAKGNDLRAAAFAVDAVATNEALLLKKMSTDDLHVDGPAAADALRKHAAALRAEADRRDGLEDDEFDLVFPEFDFCVPEATPRPAYFAGCVW